MASAQEAREARRRKILARGSDRLAFIQGELPSISSATLPSPVAPSSGDHVPSEPIPRSGDAALIRLVDTNLPGKPQESLGFASAESYHKASTEVIKNDHEQSRALAEVQDYPELEEVEDLNLNSLQLNQDVLSAYLDETRIQSGTSSRKEERLATSVLTWNGIADSIEATENYRAAAALLLALALVVLRFVFGSHLENKFSANWALPWPVALVIVTDISLVIGALALGLVRTSPLITQLDVPEFSTTDDNLSKMIEMSDKLGFGLGIGTFFFKTTRALFLDCSIYAVTVISVYTLWQNWD